MILGKNKKLLESIRDLRDYDQKKKHKIRYNYKMTDFQAALGLSQLAQLEILSTKMGGMLETIRKVVISTEKINNL